MPLEGLDMSHTFERIRHLVSRGEVVVSRHGYKELSADTILVQDAVAGVGSAEVVEEYPDHVRGPSVLLLQRDGRGEPVHVLWGIPKHRSSPAVLITALQARPREVAGRPEA
jgi:hypothetical protein